MQRILLFSLIVFGLVFPACGQQQILKDSWKFTTRQYRNFLNTPASLDMEDTGEPKDYELVLGEALLPVDAELEKLTRAMENSDHNPDQNWVMQMLGRLPWLSGVALIDQNGQMVARYPEFSTKPFDAAPLLEPDPKQRLGDLRAYVQQTDAGPEVYVGNPVYGGEEMRGLIVASFDPRALVTMSANPGSFVLASPAGILWPGAHGSQGSLVGSQDWGKILTKQSSGFIGDGNSRFFWTTRYLGNLPLVYATPESTGQGRASLEPSGTPPESAAPSAGEIVPLHEEQARNNPASAVPAMPSTRRYLFGDNAPLVSPSALAKQSARQ